MQSAKVLLLFFLTLLGCIPHSEEKEPIEYHPTLAANRYNVAFLIMDGTFNTEFTAPYDIFQHTIYRKGIKAMNVFTVAKSRGEITTFEGIKVKPDYSYLENTLPQIDILVIPSAEHHLDTDLEDTVMLNFVKRIDSSALFMTSHCDGAFVLAQAGLLDDAASTTFPGDLKKYEARFPNLDVREDVIFVHDGKYITSAGGARSFDAALYLVEYLYGKKIAQSIARGLVIDWDVDKVPHLVVSHSEN